MASIWDSLISGSAIGGAASGAAAGLMAGGGYGALAGGVLGYAGGTYTDYKRDEAYQSAKQNTSQILQNLKTMNSSQYKQHIDDINKALSFYAVPQDYWSKLYGSGTAAPATGSGAWSNTGVK